MAFTESLALKAVSLLLALILWITILGFKREEMKKNVKLEPLLPPGVVLTSKIPQFIQYTLSGPRVLLKDVERKLQPIRPDLRRTRETTLVLTISEDLIGELPAGVRVVGFYPPTILVRLEDVIERYVSVKAVFTGRPAEGEEIDKVVVTPAKVGISGPKTLVQSLDAVNTEPIDIEGLKGSRETTVAAEVDSSQGYQLSRDKTLRVRVTTRKAR